MKTISFYSYKGGVGRSLALAYTAKYLARRHIKVCVLDIDLEAPGIVYKFPEVISSVFTKFGVVDYINACINGEVPNNIEDYFTDVPLKSNEYGYIKIMGAGKGIDTGDYWANLHEVNWKELFLAEDDLGQPAGEGLYIFENLKNQIEYQIKPDFLLIDSRSGVTIMSKLCNSVLPDNVVMFLANNEENYQGSALMYNHISSFQMQKINKVKSVICAITRYPTYRDVSHETTKLRSLDLYHESHIVNYFLKIIGTSRLQKEDVSVIHSDRDVERDELSILQPSDQRIEKKIIGRDYKDLISKFIDAKLLEQGNALIIRMPKYRFIEFDLLKRVKNEIERTRRNMDFHEWGNVVKQNVKENPSDSRLLYEFALYARYNNDIVEAVMKLNFVIDNAKDNDVCKMHSLYLRGLIFLYDFSNYKNAVKDLEKLCDISPSHDHQIYYHLAVCCYCLNGDDFDKHKKAIQYVDRYLLVNVGSNDSTFNSRAYLLRAEINGEKKSLEKDEIMSDYEKAINLTPNFASIYNCRGLFHQKLNENKEALDDFNMAIDLDAEYYFAYCHRGFLFAEGGEIQKAFDDYNKAIGIALASGVSYEVAYKRRGDLYYTQGNEEKAVDDYNKAIEINPDYRAAHANKAKIITAEYYKKLGVEFQLRQYDHYSLPITTERIPIKYSRTDKYFEFATIKSGNKTFITDQGKTMEMLNGTFLLHESDVQNNLVAVLRNFQIFKNGDDFSVEVRDVGNEDALASNEEAKYRLLRCVSFMNNLHVFYSDDDNFIGSDGYDLRVLDKYEDKNLQHEIIEKFLFPIKYYKIDAKYEFVMMKKDKSFFLSDQGRTYKMLDEVFELKEPDVQKFINAIKQKYHVLQDDSEFLIEIGSYVENANIDEAKYKLLECISFMDTMRIFFV